MLFSSAQTIYMEGSQFYAVYDDTDDGKRYKISQAIDGTISVQETTEPLRPLLITDSVSGLMIEPTFYRGVLSFKDSPYGTNDYGDILSKLKEIKDLMNPIDEEIGFRMEAMDG